jgi:hypothetical protein
MKRKPGKVGTNHFSRLDYNVRRGLREIVSPSHRLSAETWREISAEFNECCAYCGEAPSAQNRGIVPDHVVPVTAHGELVLGNVIPSCQACNDSRGNTDWREFITIRHPANAEARKNAIEQYLARHPYEVAQLETSLTPSERAAYEAILVSWKELLSRARELRAQVKERRDRNSNGCRRGA